MFKQCVLFTTLVVAFVAVYVKVFILDVLLQNKLLASPNLSVSQSNFDFIVVGSGSAGSVVANRLAKNKKYSVLLLEAGNTDDTLENRMPAAFPKLFKTERDWNYETEIEKDAGNRKFYWPRGKIIGGSSSMNAMIYIRGHPEDYNEWEKLGATGWSYKDVLPYFMKMENNQRKGISSKYHGFSGDWKIGDQSDYHETMQKLEQAISKTANVPINDDFNGESMVGVGACQVNIINGRRNSLADAFLNADFLKQAGNLHIRSHAHVTRVIFEGKRAVGVEYLNEKNEKVIVKANKDVILSAGSINTPQLLLLSGVGPAEELKQFDIPVVANLAGVGKNLQDHLMANVAHNLSRPASIHSEEKNPMNLVSWLVNGRGPLSSNIGELCMFGNTKYATKDVAPDFQIIAAPVFFIDHGFVGFPGEDGVTQVCVLLKPKSRGYITLRSKDPKAPAKIVANYLTERDDVNVLIESVKVARNAFASEPIKSYLASEKQPDRASNDAEIETFVREKVTTIYHPTSTAAMGSKDDPMAVVDPITMKVHGLEGLRIADASVMPRVIRGNTNAPAAMIGERAAEKILADYQ